MRLTSGKDGSPFECSSCTERDKKQRNCYNLLGLSDNLRAVEEYTDGIEDEIEQTGCSKVFTAGLKGIRLYECPLSYITNESYDMINVVSLVVESGKLYLRGGWADQPTWLVDAYNMNRIDQAK